jgi:hypothetical protein
MTSPITVRAACVAAALSVPLFAHADTFTSSASSAGSASSGSASGSLRGSSNSSTGGDKAAVADYRIIEVAKAPDRAGIARIAMQADDPQQHRARPATRHRRQGEPRSRRRRANAQARLRLRVRARRHARGLLPRARRRLVRRTCRASGASHAQPSSSGHSGSSAFCDRTQALTAGQQDRLLRFAAVDRDELDAASNGGAALISRSGLDLSRFHIRYSHAAIAWRAESGAWSARQLYYACDEGRPRIYDQGVAGFSMGIDDPALGYVSIVWLPDDAAQSLRRASLDSTRALNLVAASYSANAYPFSLRHQNCNQWVVEMLAVAWGDLADGDDLRGRA